MFVHGGDRFLHRFQPGDGRLDFQRLAVAQDRHRHRLADRRDADHPRQLRRILHQFAAVTQNYISHLEAGAGRRTVRQDLGDQRPAWPVELKGFGQIVVDRLQQDAQPAAGDFAGRFQLVGHLDGQLDGNGERQPHIAAGTAVNLRVDPDHFAAQVEQGAAGAAGIDRHIALDERHVGAAGQIAADRADDALGRGVLQAERRADGQHPFADFQGVGIADLDRRQVVAFDLEHRHIGQFVHADHLGGTFPLVAEPRDDLVGVAGDMGVGQDETVRRNDEARTQGIGLTVARQFGPFLEEAPKEFQVRVLLARQLRQTGLAGGVLLAGRLGRADIDDRRFVLFDQLAKIRQRLRLGGTGRRGGRATQRKKQHERVHYAMANAV